MTSVFEQFFNKKKTHMKREAKTATKLEKKLKVTTGGYRARANDLVKSFKTLLNDIKEAEIELNVFK